MGKETITHQNRDSNITIVSETYLRNDFASNFKNLNLENKLSLLALPDEVDTLNKNHLHDDNFKASLYMFSSYTLYSIVNLLGKFIGFYYPEVENSITNLIRGIILIILSHVNFYLKNFDYKSEFKKPKKKLLFLFIRCFFGALCNFLLFESFMNNFVHEA